MTNESKLIYSQVLFNLNPNFLNDLVCSGGVDHLDRNVLIRIYRMLCSNSCRDAAMHLARHLSVVFDENDFLNFPSEQRSCAEFAFFQYCNLLNIQVIRSIQQAQFGDHQKSWVYLTRNAEGLYQVYKEEINYLQRPVTAPRESVVLEKLQGVAGVPKFYDVIEHAGHRFIRMELIYGQSLAEMMNTVVLPSTARRIIRDLAKLLLEMRDKGVLYLDLKPENILMTEDGLILLDYGVTALIDRPYDEVPIFLSDPRYATPEGALYRTATTASLVYQLGILYYQLLFGQHPSGKPGQLAESVRMSLFQYTARNATVHYKVPENFQNTDLIECEKLLAYDPSQRLSLEEIANWNIILPECRVFTTNPPPVLKSILFPARMGIPHKGHLDYLNRIMYCGYRVVISLQRSYTLTDRDPLPKWVVADLLVRALQSRGWVEGVHYRIIFTPFFETDQQHRRHFAKLFEYEQKALVGIASSNPNVHKLLAFTNLPILDQQCFFSCETDKQYHIRSWGEHIRQAVKDGDIEIFRQYALPEHEAVISFKETQQLYHNVHIEFVPGQVTVALYANEDLLVAPTLVRNYFGPKATLLSKLGDSIHGVIRHRSMEFDGRNVAITFDLLPTSVEGVLD